MALGHVPTPVHSVTIVFTFVVHIYGILMSFVVALKVLKSKSHVLYACSALRSQVGLVSQLWLGLFCSVNP